MEHLEFLHNKKFINISSIILLIIPLIYVIFVLWHNLEIGILGFYLMSYFSHIFFLIMIPLEALFLVEVKMGVISPLLLITSVAIVGNLAYLTNYYVGLNISQAFLEKYLSKRKFEKLEKKYRKWGVYFLFIAASTPFLPGPISTLLEGFFKEDYKRTLIIGFLGLMVKWTLFYFIFKYSLFKMVLG